MPKFYPQLFEEANKEKPTLGSMRGTSEVTNILLNDPEFVNKYKLHKSLGRIFMGQPIESDEFEEDILSAINKLQDVYNLTIKDVKSEIVEKSELPTLVNKKTSYSDSYDTVVAVIDGEVQKNLKTEKYEDKQWPIVITLATTVKGA